MNMEKTEYHNIELLLRLIENEVDDQEIEAIEKWFQADPQASSQYLEFIKDYTAIKIYGESQLTLRQADSFQLTKSFDHNLWQTLAEMEASAPDVEIQEEPERPLIQKVVYPPREKRKVTKFQIVTFIMSVAAILFFVLFIHFVPVQHGIEVAALTESVGAKWANPAVFLNPGDLIHSNEAFSLSKGFVEIQTERGVSLTVEGPAEFEFTKEADLSLSYGRIYARVNPRGIGFTVSTLNTKVVDLGTEFGVLADIGGKTELHVLKGETTLIAGTSWLAKKSQALREGQARRVLAEAVEIEEIPIQKDVFVRSIHSETNSLWRGQNQIDLADVLGGGGGFGTGQVQYGVSFKSSVIEKIPFHTGIEREGGFMRVQSSFVDGYFIPYGENVQVSSDGDVFADFASISATSLHGAYYTKVCQTDDLYTQNCENRSVEEQISAIWMHSNAGLTFSLKNIQESFPSDITVNRFTAQYSMLSETRNMYEFRDNKTKEEFTYPKVDVLVLIDGEVRFQRSELTPNEGIVPIDIEVRPEDRTLTLAVTDSGFTNHDWTVFAKPFLHISKR